MLEPAKLRVGLYGRVSVDVRDGKTVDTQLKLGRQWCIRQGHAIAGTYRDDGISASNTRKARPDWTRVMEDITSGRINALWVWEVSRTSRDRAVWAALMAACQTTHALLVVDGKVHDPNDPDDAFMLDLVAMLAVREAGMTGKRVRRHTAAAADAGTPFGPVPYGYRREYDPTSGNLIRQVRDDRTAAVVEEITARVLSGEALHRIAVDLNKRGVPTPQMERDVRAGRVGVQRGGWNNPKLRALLSAPTIVGVRVHRGVVHGPAAWEPLITVADHAAVAAILNDPTRRTQRGTAPRYLLSGIAECGVCGAWLRHVRNNGYPSYGCAGRDNTNPGHVVRRAAPLESLAVSAVIRRLTTPWAVDAIDRAGGDEELAAARDVAALQARLTEFEHAAASGNMSAAAFGRIEADLLTQLDTARQRAVPRWVPQAVRAMAGAGAAAHWDGAPLSAQRDAIRALVRVVVQRARPTNRFDPTTVEVSFR